MPSTRVVHEFDQNLKSWHVNGYNDITILFEMAQNTPAWASLIKKNISGSIDLLIMFVLVANFTQILEKLYSLLLKFTDHNIF